MTLPSLTFQIKDPSGDFSGSRTTGLSAAALGLCSGGVVGTVYDLETPEGARTALADGPLVEYAAAYLAATEPDECPRPLIAVPVTPSTFGTCGSVTESKTGTGTVTPATAPRRTITVTCTKAGNLGTAEFTFKLGSDDASQAIVSASGWSTGYLVPGTLTKLTFTVGTGYDATDAWTIDALGVITQGTNPGPGSGDITAQSSSPLDVASVIITCTTAGTLGAGAFTYSLDGGDTTEGPIQIPSGGVYALGDSGIAVTFAATFAVGDTYTFAATGPSASLSDYTAGLTTLVNSGRAFDHVVVTGTPATSSAAAAMAAAFDVALASAFTRYVFSYAVITTPTAGVSDSTTAAAFINTSSSRALVVAGDVEMVSARGGGRIDRRPGGWEASIRLAQIPESVDPLATALGPIQGITSIYRDETTAGTSLDSSRLTTFRTWPNQTGYYFTRGRMLAALGSDFGTSPRRRVMDAACRIVYNVLWRTVGATLRLLTDGSGYIDPRDAAAIEERCNAALRAGLGNQVSGASARVSRTTDLSSDETPLPVEVAIVPLKVAYEIKVTLGYRRSLP